MVLVPLVPRINGKFSSMDEATSDHQRLQSRLELYDLVEREVEGDGNCQFRALSDQFYHSSEHHEFVRQQVVNQLKAHPDIYSEYVPMDYDDYIEKMSKDGEWGDHVTLQAAADLYGVRIFVVTSFKDTCSIEILPSVQQSSKVIFLSFWAEMHYNSAYPEGGRETEVPITDQFRHLQVEDESTDEDEKVEKVFTESQCRVTDSSSKDSEEEREVTDCSSVDSDEEREVADCSSVDSDEEREVANCSSVDSEEESEVSNCSWEDLEERGATDCSLEDSEEEREVSDSSSED